MRTLVFVLLVLLACGAKKSSGVTPLGASGLAIDLSELDVGDASGLVRELKPGYWTVEAPLGQGSTHVTVKYERGMPTKSYLEGSVKEDVAMGEKASLEEGPGGMLIHSVTRTKCSTCTPGKPQHFVYAYLPTKDGAALCEGWSQESAANRHLGLCRKLSVVK